MRKNIIYPGRYLMARQGSVYAQIGTFRVHRDERVLMSTCVHDYAAVVASARQLNVINCSRVYNVFENVEDFDVKRLKTHHVVQ